MIRRAAAICVGHDHDVHAHGLLRRALPRPARLLLQRRGCQPIAGGPKAKVGRNRSRLHSLLQPSIDQPSWSTTMANFNAVVMS